MEKKNKQSNVSDNAKISIAESIEKTGFVLEHKVASLLEASKWAVIHNRYYLDDVTSVQREMDIIAYRTDLLADNVKMYTTLIISCKKNVEYDWVFLTRKAHGMSLNLDMLPVQFSSNQDVFNFQITNMDWTKEKFINSYDVDNLINNLYYYDKVVFAYQEIKKSNNAPSNDSNIYASIASLIKAQSYEISSLKDGRKKEAKYVYNINLLSVADIDFYELHYENKNVTTTSIERINYLNRFLIKNEAQHSKIDFINFKMLQDAISDYNKLHHWNVKFYNKICDQFYKDVFTDYDKRSFMIKKTKTAFLEKIKNLTRDSIGYNFSFLILEKIDNTVNINISDNSEINETLNKNEKLVEFTKSWLSKNFKYNGKFIFTEDLFPF